MAVKKLTKDQIIEMLGVELTDEQKDKLANDYEIEMEDKQMTFEEVQKVFKKDLDEMKKTTIKKRFKNQEEEQKPKDETFDVEKFREEALAETRKSVKIESLINSLKEEDREDANALVNAKIAKGSTLEDAITSTKDRFVKKETKKSINDFGMPAKHGDDGKIVDEVAEELKKYTK